MKYFRRGVAVAVFSILLPMVFTETTSAAVPYAASFSASAAADTLSATTTMTSAVPTFVTTGGICATGADGVRYAFPKLTNFTLGTTPITFTTSRTVPVGQVYTYWTCLLINGSWTSAPGSKGIFVAGAIPASVDNSMPVGNLPGWTQTFANDFSQPAIPGTFSSIYASKWISYNGFKDTSGAGTYDSNSISAHDGKLDESLFKSGDGITHVAAVAPVVTTPWVGQIYGKFSVRFQADALAGFKTAFLVTGQG